jgi:hypothetical protein
MQISGLDSHVQIYKQNRDNAFYNQQDIDNSGLKIDLW